MVEHGNRTSAITEARTDFVDRLLEEGNSGGSFYSAVRQLASPAAQSQWAVGGLFPGLSPADVCDEVLGFYSSIATAPPRPLPTAPTYESGGLGHFSKERTTSLLAASKKSIVDGDPLAHLVRRFPEAFAVPISAIFNAVNESGRWPTQWKTEHPQSPKSSRAN